MSYKLPAFVVVNQGMVYCTTTGKLVRRDLLAEADQKLIGFAPLDWLEQNPSVPGFAEMRLSSEEAAKNAVHEEFVEAVDDLVEEVIDDLFDADPEDLV